MNQKTTRFLKTYFIVFLLFIVIDGSWLFLMKDFYTAQLGHLMSDGSANLLVGLFAWALLALGITIFVIPTGRWWMGSLYGLVVYGVYDLTNLYFIAGYSIFVSAVDILWGIALNSLVALLYFLIQKTSSLG